MLQHATTGPLDVLFSTQQQHNANAFKKHSIDINNIIVSNNNASANTTAATTPSSSPSLSCRSSPTYELFLSSTSASRRNSSPMIFYHPLPLSTTTCVGLTEDESLLRTLKSHPQSHEPSPASSYRCSPVESQHQNSSAAQSHIVSDFIITNALTPPTGEAASIKQEDGEKTPRKRTFSMTMETTTLANTNKGEQAAAESNNIKTEAKAQQHTSILDALHALKPSPCVTATKPLLVSHAPLSIPAHQQPVDTNNTPSTSAAPTPSVPSTPVLSTQLNASYAAAAASFPLLPPSFLSPTSPKSFWRTISSNHRAILDSLVLTTPSTPAATPQPTDNTTSKVMDNGHNKSKAKGGKKGRSLSLSDSTVADIISKTQRKVVKKRGGKKSKNAAAEETDEMPQDEDSHDMTDDSHPQQHQNEELLFLDFIKVVHQQKRDQPADMADNDSELDEEEDDESSSVDHQSSSSLSYTDQSDDGSTRESSKRGRKRKSHALNNNNNSESQSIIMTRQQYKRRAALTDNISNIENTVPLTNSPPSSKRRRRH